MQTNNSIRHNSSFASECNFISHHRNDSSLISIVTGKPQMFTKPTAAHHEAISNLVAVASQNCASKSIERMLKITQHKAYIICFIVLIALTLVIDEVRIIGFPLNYDKVAFGIELVLLLMFIADLCLMGISEKAKYLLSLYFVFDLVTIVALILENDMLLMGK
jgi:hypothetical protein